MFKNNWAWAIIGIVSLLVRWLASRFPAHTEYFYSRGTFLFVRQLIDMTIARFSFPTVCIFVAGLLLVGGWFFFRIKEKQGWKVKFLYSIRTFANLLGVIIFFFLLLWGFNYQRIPIVQQLSLLPEPLSREQLSREIHFTKNTLFALRSKITGDTAAIEETIPYIELEKLVREEMKQGLPLLGLKNGGHPRTKEFYPAGFLRKMGILGIYFPFTGESYIDPTLHELEKPFTVAHEMAHSFGITDEGEANFISWVVCSQSGNLLLQYAAQLQLFRYQLNELYRTDRPCYRRIVGTLEPGVRNDMISIIKNNREIQPISRDISRKSNDLFLKSQGVEAGVKSYAQLPMLVYSWRNRKNEE